jgi:outer membrane protein OmpA-like peptidoglycan-associated protein
MKTHTDHPLLRHGSLAVLALSLLATGCASHKFVRTQNETTRSEIGQEIEGVSGQVEEVQSDVAQLEGTVDDHGQKIDGLSQTTQEALDRALAAGKLAEGKFLYETVLSDDKVQFAFEKAALSDTAQAELDRFASELAQNNANVYVEIQGHTDSSGDEGYNLQLGEERAEAVRRYLSLEHDVPLHRMATISYGESAPLEENSTREGRARNRRVSLVVLQ